MHDLDLIRMEYAAQTEEPDGWAPSDTSTEETELAYELITVEDPAELDQFIGKVLKGAAKTAGRALRSDVGRAAGGLVRDAIGSAARKAIPNLGGAVGRTVGRRLGSGSAGERIGRRISQAVLDRAGQGEMEFGGVDEEVSLEVARGLVRFAGDTARLAAQAGQGEDPGKAALTAALRAAREQGAFSGTGRSLSGGGEPVDEFGFPEDSGNGGQDDGSDEDAEAVEAFRGTEDMDEGEELELAAEVLEAGTDADLDEFLGKIAKRAGRAVKRAVRKPVAKKMAGVLKGVARKALPIAGGAAGTALGGPLGGTAGAALGSAAGNMFELELEGLSPEDQEFEVARRFVRLANEAAVQAALTPPDLEPEAAARQALEAAAGRYAPGLVRAESELATTPRSGRWVRRGRSIIITGV
ncbi:hypothetical protein GCM10007079_18300 [Nocardiopsis terrae]|uniref:Uncharacterized protein (DUF697 family) n=1 Tax=Nocardiopsis terrae TaxID=372655 RepID=A0ABR9HHQ4_9ACTN|nr:hypothetical protein [Nocardiopsis terrae]MBE1458545.1 uncharacterized protein (DUF697 family) [Nocardiopsis terrae]GHC79835.1 hypothetical protein GCM10007079_18300 [Nocardiopsis terrae]